MRANGWSAVGVVLLSAVASAIDVSSLMVLKGTGTDDSEWKSAPFKLEPTVPYVLSCQLRHLVGNDAGVAIVNPAGTPMYWRPKGHDWCEFAEAFAAGNGGKATTCTLRQWHVSGEVEFRDVKIRRARARYRRFGALELGYGEQMDGHTYRFGTRLSDATHLQSRPLAGYKDLSTSNGALTFYRKSELSYAHDLKGRRFLSAEVSLSCEGEKKGAVSVFVSRDGSAWSEVGAVSNTGVHRFPLPAAFFPAERLQVRLRNVSGGTSVRVFQYAFDAEVDGSAVFGF